MNNGKRGRTFSPRWIAWPRSIQRKAGVSQTMNPNWKQIVREHLAVLRLAPEREIEIVEELALHLEAAYEDALADDLSETEAEARAAQGYDWRVLECELSRAEHPVAARAFQPALEMFERKGETRMESFLQDLRFGARMLMKQPGFTLFAALTLALGIGANTAIFSIVNAVLLHPLPFAEPERLMWFGGWVGADREQGVTPADFLDYREQSRSFTQIAASVFDGTLMNLSGAGEPEPVMGVYVTGNYMDVFGVKPALGRTFAAEEGLEGNNMEGGDRVVVLSHRLWQRRFGGDLAIINLTVMLVNRNISVTGMAPPPFP